MNLYRISQSVNSGWDTYDSAIVAAESEDSARLIYPGGEELENRYRAMFWADDPLSVEVEFIGIARESMPHGVVLASFNAS